MNDCYFCTAINEKSEHIFFENEEYIVMWDGNPIVPGHALVIPKRHIQYIEQLNEAEASQIMIVAQQATDMIRKTNFETLYSSFLPEEINEMRRYYYRRSIKKFQKYDRSPEAFNYGINDGPEAGQSVPHVHLHVIPRWAGDVEKPRGGIRNMFASDKYSAEP